MTKFRKGDKVAVLASWDNKGRIRIRRATVHSCGPQVMRLQDAGGETFKVAYRPENATMAAFNGLVVVPDDADERLEQLAGVLGGQVITDNVDRLSDLLDRYQGAQFDAYRATVGRDLADLQDRAPSCFWHGTA